MDLVVKQHERVYCKGCKAVKAGRTGEVLSVRRENGD